jgi:hypothetical protein
LLARFWQIKTINSNRSAWDRYTNKKLLNTKKNKKNKTIHSNRSAWDRYTDDILLEEVGKGAKEHGKFSPLRVVSSFDL